MAPEQKAERQKQGKTLFRRMLAFFIAVLMAQMLIYLAVFFTGGILGETEDNSFYILSERTNNRKLDLENDMVQRWSNVSESKNDVLTAVGDTMLAHGVSIAELHRDPVLCQEALAASAESLVSTLRRNGVTGTFAILDCPNAQEEYPGVYIRDYDPMNYASDNADLLLERGLPEVSRTLGIPMDSYWTANFRFREKPNDAATFFAGPIAAARAVTAEERQEDYFYHWSSRFALSEADRPVITYTVPLVWADGTVIGVVGVDLTVDYLAEQLKYDELGEENSGAYFLGITTDGGKTYSTVCTSGPNYRAYFGQGDVLTVEPDAHPGIVSLPNPRHGEFAVYGAVQPLKLYNTNTPFENEQWALIGILSGEHLLRFSHRVRTTLLLSMGLSLLLGLSIIFMAARSFTRPISELMSDLRRSDPNKPIRLRATKITELDALSASIEDLSDAAAESASRISKIIAMSHIPIGVFEYRQKAGKVFCSRSLFQVLNWPERPEEDLYLPEREFLWRMNQLTLHEKDALGDERIFCLTDGDGERWVQIFYREEGGNALGAFMDVTDYVQSKRKIEYERDYDILTGLYNRRAFDQKLDALFAHKDETPLGVAALIMLDLDNLKYTNDTYGHDYGDRYIQAFAHCLEYFYPSGGLVGRRSGDEFNVFLYGHKTEDEVRKLTREFWELLGKANLSLPDGGQIRVRASGGIAWYGKDAGNYAELLRLSDFAMYNVKHTAKGALKEFSSADYAHKSILIRGQDALNRMLENRMVRYALQPIVSAVDGSVYGYEFLMRPMVEQLSNLDALFRLAKAQSKLQQIEEMTWLEAMERFSDLVEAGKLPEDARAFINSVGNQALPTEVFAQIEERYKGLLSRVVIEITENEESSRDISRLKKNKAAQWGGMLALDDYGTGYNGETVLMNLSPDIVKIDLHIVHEIDTDSDKHAIVRNLVAYAKSRNIKVLAEGVENAEELKTVIECGVDYLQGYYLARPSFEVPEVSAAVVKEICHLHRQNREKT